MTLHDYAFFSMPADNLLLPSATGPTAAARPCHARPLCDQRKNGPHRHQRGERGASNGAHPGICFLRTSIPPTPFFFRTLMVELKRKSHQDNPIKTTSSACISPAARPTTAVLLCMVGRWVGGSVMGVGVGTWYTRAGHVFRSAGAAPYHAENTPPCFVLAC